MCIFAAAHQAAWRAQRGCVVRLQGQGTRVWDSAIKQVSARAGGSAQARRLCKFSMNDAHPLAGALGGAFCSSDLPRRHPGKVAHFRPRLRLRSTWGPSPGQLNSVGVGRGQLPAENFKSPAPPELSTVQRLGSPHSRGSCG